MNTNQPDNNQSQSTSNNNPLQVSEPVSAPDSGQSLTDLVEALQSVDTNKPEASLNATSIDDNNGGRIELNQDGEVTKK